MGGERASAGDSVRLVVGLGNPGRQYEGTRHNVGFMVLDELARRHGVEFAADGRRQGEIARVPGRPWAMVKPMTFMNLSGRCASGFAHFFKIPSVQVLVVYDDVDLPLGSLRLREGGSAGGHNGLASIIEHFGTDKIPRLRVGIGEEGGTRPKGDDMVGHVLSNFREEERKGLRDLLDRAAAAVDCAMGEGLAAAMNLYNRREKRASSDDGEEKRPGSESGGQQTKQNA